MSEDMLEEVSCPSCGAHFRVRREQLGLKGKCKCGHSFTLQSGAGAPGKNELSDDDILATLADGQPAMRHPVISQPSSQGSPEKEPLHWPKPSNPLEPRSAAGIAAIERTSETGRPIPRYGTLKAMGFVFRILGLVVAIVALACLGMGLYSLYGRLPSAAATAAAYAGCWRAVALFFCAIIELGIAEAIFAFRDLVINSWKALEK
ncbi:MAG: hypothetical protein QUV05_18425 [Phycisphaerae bacterium]|nr:hypothetical protein [Phycisphaerae bacterium]